MAQRETDLERITTLLGQCLGRIDEQAFRIQCDDVAQDPDGAAFVLEQEAAELQELVGSLMLAEQQVEQADLNRIVDRAVRGCVAEASVPIVSRQQLDRNLPQIACSPGQVAFAVQRGVMLGLACLGPGDELTVSTRSDGETAVFELEARGNQRDRHQHERAASLVEFTQGLGGTCRVDVDSSGHLLLALELPTALAADER